MARKLYLVLDTETVTPAREVFDLGYKLVDRNGEVYTAGSYVARETVGTVEGIAAMFSDRFTKGKAPHYFASLIGGEPEFELADFADIRDEVNAVIAAYHPVLCAYNVAFDLNALNKTSQRILGCDFFEEMPELLDIWAAAMSTICKAARFIRFLADNAILTDNGNPQTGAEAVYRFLTDDPEFEEAHTARADCEIEAEILAACFRTRKRMNREPVRMCLHHPDWQEIVKRYHEFAD